MRYLTFALTKGRLAEKTLEIEEQLAKIEGVRSQLQSAVDTSNAEEARLRSEFEADDTALVEQAKNLSAMRAEIEAALPASLVSLYEKTTAKAGGVAARFRVQCSGYSMMMTGLCSSSAAAATL